MYRFVWGGDDLSAAARFPDLPDVLILDFARVAIVGLDLERKEEAADTTEQVGYASGLEHATMYLTPPAPDFGLEPLPDPQLKSRLRLLGHHIAM